MSEPIPTGIPGLTDEERQQFADPDHEPDLLGDHVERGVAFLHMTDADKDAWAERVGGTRSEIDEIYERMKRAWTDMDPSELTDDEYRRLFGRDKP